MQKNIFCSLKCTSLERLLPQCKSAFRGFVPVSHLKPNLLFSGQSSLREWFTIIEVKYSYSLQTP